MDLTPILDAFAADTTPLVRTDFTSDSAWQTVVREVSRPVDLDDPGNPSPGSDGYAPMITAVDDRALDGVTGAALGEAFVAAEKGGSYVLLADARSIADAGGNELTLDYVDLSVSDPEDAELFDSFMGRTFRCVVSEVASVEVNLTLGNMDFSEFADSVGPDGVFRGFEADD